MGKKPDPNLLIGLAAVVIAALVLLYGDNWLGEKHGSEAARPHVADVPLKDATSPTLPPTATAQPTTSRPSKSSQAPVELPAADPPPALLAAPQMPLVQPDAKPAPVPASAPADPIAPKPSEPLQYSIGKLRFRTWPPRVTSQSPAIVRVHLNIGMPYSVKDASPLVFEIDDQLRDWVLEAESATCRGAPRQDDPGAKKKTSGHSYQLNPGADYDFYIEYSCSRPPRSGEKVTSTIQLKFTQGSAAEGLSADSLVQYGPNTPPIY